MAEILNVEIAQRLREVAALLQEQGANPFRLQAYRHAADTVQRLDRPAAEIVKAEGMEGLRKLPGIGESLARSIRDLIVTGRLPMLDRLRGETDHVAVLASVPGIGEATAKRLHHDLGIDTLEELETAAHDGRLSEIEGIGPKKLAGIIDSLAGRLGRVRGRTGAAAAHGAPKIAKPADPRLRQFRAAFNAVLGNLAEQVARDGEGARKLVEIEVEGAVSKASARRIAMSIANSPLVKTAIAGEDANWGRVVMAVGKAGEPADRDKLSIWFNGIRVAHKGARDPAYDEARVSERMKAQKISMKVELGLGRGADRVLTCDLTKEYVAINGDYRS